MINLGQFEGQLYELLMLQILLCYDMNMAIAT